MNRSHKLIIFFSLAAFVLCPVLLPRAEAAGPDEFSATMVAEAGGITSTAKIYHAQDRTRIESGGEDTGVAIARQDKGVAWLLVPAAKSYIEVQLSTLKTTALTLGNDVVLKRERVGTETINGLAAVKEKVTVRSPDGSKNTLFYWQAEGMDWPVKAAATDGSWSYTFTDVKAGKQDASLFEIPEGYQKMPDTIMPGDQGLPDDEGDV